MPSRAAVSALCLVGLLAVGGAGPVLAGEASELPHAKDDMRMPWSRNHERHLRTWLVAGELEAPKGKDGLTFDFLAQEGGEAAAAPVEGQKLARPDGSTITWGSYVSWDDNVTLEEPVGQYPRRTGIAYAFAITQRAADGPALLSMGSDEGLRVWLNGKLVHEHRGRRDMTHDEDQVDVTMVAGENRILVKTEQEVGHWDFSLRVLEPGARLARRQEITPSIVEQGAKDTLAIRTHSRAGSEGQAPVTVAVVGPGGAVWAHQITARGETVTFSTTDWPMGPAEVRCSTLRPDGRPYATHLSYFKGDAVVSIQPLIDAAKAADSSTRSGILTKMLADLARDRLDGQTKGPWHLVHSPLMEWEELKLEAAGKGSASRPYGFVRLAYVDDVDGTPQYARAYLPPDYDPAKSWPVVVQLHGYNGANPEYVRWWSVGERHNEYADNHGVIWIEPHGRGNTMYRGMGEKDVVRCVELAKQRFNVDADRVYLTGDSMGGWGTWQVGTRHPELFAAIAPVFGGADYRVDIPDEVFAQMNAEQRFMAERGSSFAQAEALRNVPIFILHGDHDASVKVDYSRYAVRMLQRWGYDVRYQELPGFGHEDLPARSAMVEWFLRHTRNAQPRRVRVRAAELKSAAAHWVRITRTEVPLRFMNADVEVIDHNVIRLDTDNATEVVLTPPEPLVDLSRPIEVIWNGVPRSLSADGGRLALLAEGTSPAPLHKRPELEGPIEDLHATPFAVVVGTASTDPGMNAMCAAKAEVFAETWRSWQKHRPRVFKDTELSPEDAARYSLLLIGGPEANAVTKKIASQLPLTVSADAVTIDGRSFPATDAAVQMIYPSPLNPDRYVSVVAGTSADGLYFWDPILFDNSLGPWDFAILDGRTQSGAGHLPAEMRRVVSGLFDQDWRLAAEATIEGDAATRANNRLTRAPRAKADVDPRTWTDLPGRYAGEQGADVTITRRGARLFAAMGGGPAGEVLPVSENELAFAAFNARILPKRDTAGKIAGLTVLIAGRESAAQRVD